MTSLRRVACAVLTLTVVAACSGAGPKDDPAVKRDFMRYKAKMAKVVDMESEALAAHVKATEDPSINDASYGVFLRDVFLPRLAAFYGELKRISPVTAQIMDLHMLFLKRTAYMISGFSDLERSARTGSAALIESSKAKNADSDLLFKGWKQRMDELNEQYSE